MDGSCFIFAVVVARLFDPVFEAVGVENIFDSFSGRAQLDDLLKPTLTDVQAKWLQGDEYLSAPPTGFVGDGDAFAEAQVVAPVPEPSVLALLLGPTAYLIGRRLRR